MTVNMHLPKRIFPIVPFLLFCLFHSTLQGQSALIRQEQNRLPLIKDSSHIVNSFNRIGMLYHLKNPDSCFYYGMKAKSIAIRLHYRKGETNADNVIASALFLKGLFHESLDLFSKTLSVYQMQSDTGNTAQVLMNMATVYLGIGDTIRARSFSVRAIQTGRQLRKDSIMSMIYANYCIVNTNLSDDSMQYYLRKSTNIADRYKDERMLIVTLQLQAQSLLNRGRTAEALPMIQKSLAESQKAGMEYFEINSLGLYAAYYEKRPDSVLLYYNRAYNLVLEKGYVYLQVKILKIILAYTELSGNKDEIIRIRRLMVDALTVENENLKKFIGDYVQYNTIRDDNRLLEISNKSNRIKIWLLTAVCSVIVLLLIFIYRLYNTSRRFNSQISEQNKQMRETLSALEQSQQDNTRMMQIVAHDLRNPIGGITSVASLMLDETGLSEDQRMMLELIRTSGLNSLEMVSDLLQVHTRTEDLQKEDVDLSQILHYCADLLRHKAEAKGQLVELQTMPVTLPVNREKIWRLVSNLITNAIKFSPSGAHIVVRLEKTKDWVVIAVEDHGIGIPAEIGARIFDMFTEAKRPGTAGEQPFGLGLAISKQIVDAHGGHIWFDSQAGNGTTFYVELPWSSQPRI